MSPVIGSTPNNWIQPFNNGVDIMSMTRFENIFDFLNKPPDTIF